jgi:hypothetical protein
MWKKYKYCSNRRVILYDHKYRTICEFNTKTAIFENYFVLKETDDQQKFIPIYHFDPTLICYFFLNHCKGITSRFKILIRRKQIRFRKKYIKTILFACLNIFINDLQTIIISYML